MTDRFTEERLYDEMLRAIDRLGDLPARQEQERVALQAQIRASLNQVLTEERNTKDAVGDARRQLDALVGRAGRLAARSGGAQGPASAVASPPLPGRVSEFARAVDGAHHDLKAVESAWDWVERARANAARASTVASDAPARPAERPPEEPAMEAPVKRRGCMGRLAAMFGHAILVTALAAWVRRSPEGSNRCQ